MAHVVACYKWVLDEADVRVNADGSVDLSRAKGKISEYDKNAIAAAVACAEQDGASPVGLTLGDDSSKGALKDGLSRGIDEVYWVHGADVPADGRYTGAVLANAIRQIDDVDLVVCAEGSSDQFARQTAPRVAACLDVPCVSSVTAVKIEGGKLVAERTLDGCIEKVEVALPCVIAVQPQCIEAPIPGLKAIMAAKKKPVHELDAAEVAAGATAAAEVRSMKAATVDRKQVRIEEDTPEATAKALVAALQKEGVL